jgi:hypothetical protein
MGIADEIKGKLDTAIETTVLYRRTAEDGPDHRVTDREYVELVDATLSALHESVVMLADAVEALQGAVIELQEDR